MNPTASPPSIYCNALAYDSESDKIIMYSGVYFYDSTYTLVKDTWAYDFNENTWRKMSDGPTGRFGHNMVYDTESDRIIMFSGAYMDNGIQHFNDLWTYDYNTDRWTEQKPERMPPPRHYYQMAYHSRADRVVVWSGWTHSGEDRNIWTYDLNTNTWTEMKSMSGPEPGGYGSIVYDEESDRIVLFGGLHNGRSDTWTYDLEDHIWTKMAPSMIPGQLSRLNMAYCQSVDRVILFGGQIDSSQFVYSDQTWTYDYNANLWEYTNPMVGDYLGQKPPGQKPERFAPGVVSTPFLEHSAVAFSADGKELYWSPDFREFGPLGAMIYVMRQANDQWTSPRPASFSTPYTDYNPVLTPDGRRLFFFSSRPNKYQKTESNENFGIWMVERTKTGWTEPRYIEIENIPGYLMTQFSLTRDGILYFSSSDEKTNGSWDIYRSCFENGKFVKTTRLEDTINTSYWETYPYIAPDESYLIFTSRERPDGFGGMDLYISYRDENDSWLKPINMGEKINSSHTDGLAAVSPDGKYLFFISDRDGNVDMYWIDTIVIDELRTDQTG